MLAAVASAGSGTPELELMENARSDPVTESTLPPPPRAGRSLRDDIQALRALAVLLVLAYHLWPRRVPGGYVGVDAFFVISGYLITGHLAKEAASGGISLRDFWIRRARRLLPSSLLVLALSALATFVWLPKHAWEQTFREIGASVLYAQNWVLAHDAVDYLASENKPSIVQHYWTLSMEEQFYIALPLLLVGALALRLRVARIPLLLGAIAIASFAWSILLTARNQPVAYFVTTTRAWEFAVGGILATAGWRAPDRLRGVAVWSGLAMIVAAGLLYDERTPFPGYLAALPVLGTAAVLWAAVERGLAARLAGLPPVRMIGDVSYALYLWHWPLIQLAPRLLGEHRRWHAPVIAAVSILAAWMTTRWLEEPIRSRPIGRGSGRAILLGSATAAAVVLAFAWFGLRAVRFDESSLAALTGAVRDADPECFGAAAMTRPCPPAGRIVPDLDQMHRDRSNRRPCWSDNGESEFRICSLGPQVGYSRRLMAVGDSHNNGLISAYEWIAATANWRIDVAGKGGCYLTTAKIRQYQVEFRAQCESWIEQLRAHLAANEPYDALIVTHWEGFPLLLEEGESQLGAETEGLVEAWSEQTARGVPILAIKDVPRMPPDILECVRQHGLAAERECSIDRHQGVRLRDSQQEATRRVSGAHLIDLDDLFCGAERCSPVVGGVAVYWSDGHVTATFGRTLAPYLLAEMRDVLD